VKKHVTSLAPLAALLMLACVERDTMSDDSVEGGDDFNEASASAGLDCEGGDDFGDGSEFSDDTGDTGESPGDGDCSLGEYSPRPYSEMPDWSNLSGLVSHRVSHSDSVLGHGSSHQVGARFYTTDYVDDSLLCMETIVEPTGVDSCLVYYSRGQGLGTETPDNWYDDLPVETVTFDVGDGPISLDVAAPTVHSPTSYGAELSLPVPFGEAATLVATFDGLPDIELDLEVPSDILPLGHALDTMTLSSEELASWSWPTPGGAAPVKLEVNLGATPAGTGWQEWVEIRCEVTDDGEFAFPVEYLELARERLGPDIYASSRIAREATGTTMLAGKQLLWRSIIEAWLPVEVVD
jgi:hypothetical protein